MNFQIFVTDRSGLQQFYEAIISKNETFAPVEKFGKYDYKRVHSLKECDTDSPIALTMSVKPLFFPRSAKILKYTATSTGTGISETGDDPLSVPRVILGLKHCDARGLQVLEKVYQWDYKDDNFRRRRENTVIISTRCDKADTHCFCTSLDYDVEKVDAFDVLVVNGKDGKVYITARTEKGEGFLKENLSRQLALGGGQEAGGRKQEAGGRGQEAGGSEQEAEKEMKRQYEAFQQSFRLKMNYEEVQQKLQSRFESPAWEDASRACVSCNTCAFICPTCHCFKISDEKIKDTGVRYKSYDSCNNVYFTLMAGGHNPRHVKYRRWRQRGNHKFIYYKERFGVNLCVGCGKCAIFCPVNISIFEVVNQVANASQ